jgi:large subunit ribosomal protein LP2
MKYIAAYALLVLGGNASPKAADVEKVLKEAGIKSEAEHVERLVNALQGKAFHELVQSGTAKLGSMGTVQAAPAAAGAGNAAPAKAAAKVEEKPKEEEADVDMGGLFGDEY